MNLRARLAVLPLSVFVASCANASAPLPEVSAPLPYLARATLAGPTLDVDRLSGKVVVVNFWSPG